MFVVIVETTVALSLMGSWVRFPFLVVFVFVFRPHPWRLGVVFPFELVALEVMLLSGVSSPKGSWGSVDVAARASGWRTAIEKRRWAIRQSPPTIRFGRGRPKLRRGLYTLLLARRRRGDVSDQC